MANIVQKKLRSLPYSPGVYLFYDQRGEILYVGKATSLKDRVSSYFQKTNGYPRPIEENIALVKDIKIRKTDTVLEAYILEQSFIKEYQPKFNAMGKDDKSFAYVLLSKEEFPRFVVMRATEVAQILNFQFSISNQFLISNYKIPKKIPYSKIYGPYTSRWQIETAL
jgi:excinuclease ABC subunit C